MKSLKQNNIFFNMTLEKARLKFSIDTQMLKGVKVNFSSEPKYEDKLWQCEFCLRVDSTRHIKICPFFKEQRADKNLNDDNDLISYFQEVMMIRMREEC